jgi:hypothetical protein
MSTGKFQTLKEFTASLGETETDMTKKFIAESLMEQGYVRIGYAFSDGNCLINSIAVYIHHTYGPSRLINTLRPFCNGAASLHRLQTMPDEFIRNHSDMHQIANEIRSLIAIHWTTDSVSLDECMCDRAIDGLAMDGVLHLMGVRHLIRYCLYPIDGEPLMIDYRPTQSGKHCGLIGYRSDLAPCDIYLVSMCGFDHYDALL